MMEEPRTTCKVSVGIAIRALSVIFLVCQTISLLLSTYYVLSYIITIFVGIIMMHCVSLAVKRRITTPLTIYLIYLALFCIWRVSMIVGITFGYIYLSELPLCPTIETTTTAHSTTVGSDSDGDDLDCRNIVLNGTELAVLITGILTTVLNVFVGVVQVRYCLIFYHFLRINDSRPRPTTTVSYYNRQRIRMMAPPRYTPTSTQTVSSATVTPGEHDSLPTKPPSYSFAVSPNVDELNVNSLQQTSSGDLEPGQIQDDVISSHLEPSQTQNDVFNSRLEPSQLQDDVIRSSLEPSQIQDDVMSPHLEPSQTQNDVFNSRLEPSQIHDDVIRTSLERGQIHDEVIRSSLEPSLRPDDVISSQSEPSQVQDDVISSNLGPSQIQDDVCDDPPPYCEVDQQEIDSRDTEINTSTIDNSVDRVH